MLAKLTSKNQLTLPRAVTDALGPVEYFEIEQRGGQLVLTPVRPQRGDAVRAKLAELDLTEQDLHDAVAWARQGSGATETTPQPSEAASPLPRKRAKRPA